MTRNNIFFTVLLSFVIINIHVSLLMLTDTNFDLKIALVTVEIYINYDYKCYRFIVHC